MFAGASWIGRLVGVARVHWLVVHVRGREWAGFHGPSYTQDTATFIQDHSQLVLVVANGLGGECQREAQQVHFTSEGLYLGLGNREIQKKEEDKWQEWWDQIRECVRVCGESTGRRQEEDWGARTRQGVICHLRQEQKHLGGKRSKRQEETQHCWNVGTLRCVKVSLCLFSGPQDIARPIPPPEREVLWASDLAVSVFSATKGQLHHFLFWAPILQCAHNLQERGKDMGAALKKNGLVSFVSDSNKAETCMRPWSAPCLWKWKKLIYANLSQFFSRWGGGGSGEYPYVIHTLPDPTFLNCPLPCLMATELSCYNRNEWRWGASTATRTSTPHPLSLLLLLQTPTSADTTDTKQLPDLFWWDISDYWAQHTPIKVHFRIKTKFQIRGLDTKQQCENPHLCVYQHLLNEPEMFTSSGRSGMTLDLFWLKFQSHLSKWTLCYVS